MLFRDPWLLVGGALALIGFGASQPIISGVGFLVLLVGGGARLWSRHLFSRLVFTSELGESRAFVGEPVRLRLSIENRKLLPLPWFEWRLALSDPITVEGEVLAAAAAPGTSWLVRTGALGWYERRTWTFTFHAAVRGRHAIGPAALRSADILGLFPRTTEITPARFVIVYPRVYRLSELGLPSIRPFGDLGGRNRVFEDPLRVAGLRDYRPGDPLRRIDWKASARAGVLASRLYEPSATRQVYLILNVDTLGHSWEGYLSDDLERTISVAASIATWTARQRLAVGLLANGAYPSSDRPMRLPPSRAPAQVTRILEALAVIQPLTMGDLATTLLRERNSIPLGSTLVVIASFVSEPLAGALLRLWNEGHEVVLVATGPRAAAAAPRGIPVHIVGETLGREEVVA